MKEKNMNMTETILMAENAMTPPSSTQATIANEAAISPKLQRWVDFVELLANEVEPVHQDDDVAPCIKEAEEIKRAKADKRLNATLRKLEVEQKAILLAEAKESIEAARRTFESETQVPYDYTPGPPISINDLFREAKAREELKALEREQKEELLRQVMEKRAKELGDDWPRIQKMSQDPRFDHIPKYWPGEKEIMAKAFPWASNNNTKGTQ